MSQLVQCQMFVHSMAKQHVKLKQIKGKVVPLHTMKVYYGGAAALSVTEVSVPTTKK